MGGIWMEHGWSIDGSYRTSLPDSPFSWLLIV